MSFSFGQATTGGGFTFGAPKTTASASAAPSFSLQTSAPAAGGFTFGAVAPQQSQAPVGTSQIAGLLAQPTMSTAASQGGFSFGASSQSSTAGGGFNFGAAPKLDCTFNPAVHRRLQLSRGQGSGSCCNFSAEHSFLLTGGQSTGLTLGAVAPASAASSTGINFGIKPAATPAPAITAAAAASQAAPISSLFASPIPSAASTGFSLGGPTSAAAPAASSAVTASTGLTLKPLGAATTTTTTTAATTAAATAPATTSFSLGLKPAASAAPATSTVVSTAAVTASAEPVMSYAQLESLINKWSSELEDQERHFLQQATQVNAWDRMLVENGEKITSLHKDMEKVKLDQRRLDQELDFILSQQKELEDLLAPLEESVKEQSGTIYMQNADEERERTYKLAENVDAQLKRMSQDLKEIIEHLNTSNSLADTSDPLQQICKILNAHMDSLQWVEQNSVLLQRRVEEVSKLCESRSKEQEKSFRLSFQ
ncbi:hypothetical protein PHYPO_G00220890 [Pangasianodon hypophthalmus]|uniref:Nuclear pore glycoprotein p62 n=1 Tax=Pangasianodon hypophthalmus TaxID=310915 RepID=A0A5N5NX09_PANHP|nr:hypothetical protein PHYPO_G00220890 [Pangasianodon hypophthalmus]